MPHLEWAKSLVDKPPEDLNGQQAEDWSYLADSLLGPLLDLYEAARNSKPVPHGTSFLECDKRLKRLYEDRGK